MSKVCAPWMSSILSSHKILVEFCWHGIAKCNRTSSSFLESLSLYHPMDPYGQSLSTIFRPRRGTHSLLRLHLLHLLHGYRSILGILQRSTAFTSPFRTSRFRLSHWQLSAQRTQGLGFFKGLGCQTLQIPQVRSSSKESVVIGLCEGPLWCTNHS